MSETVVRQWESNSLPKDVESNQNKPYQEPDTEEDNGDENIKRGNWTGKFDFILSCIGYAVGLGNVWRFPFLCYRNGGGAFLFPYAIMLLIAGIPLFYMELSFGQFANLGPISAWRVVPLMKGLGYASVVISALVSIYYNIIIAWAIYYFFASMQAKLPWSDCFNDWNDDKCRNLLINATNGSNVPGNSRYNYKPKECNKTITTDCTIYQTAAEQYWERKVLGLTDKHGNQLRLLEDNFGEPMWHLSLCLLLAWILCFVCLIKGVKSSGKVVYFTALFPYAVMIILVIYSATLNGSYDGILFYLTPKWDLLLTAKPWGDAAIQIFYSLGVSFGGLQTMASYNKFKNNCYRDSLIVTLINCCTSVFAGFAIFSVIGYMAIKTGLPIENVVKEGPGFAFIVYPEGIATMPAPQLWSILFFGMLLTLGLDSQFGMVETVISGIADEFPMIAGRTFKRKMLFIGAICLFMFCMGLPIVCRQGIYLFTLVDWYCAGYSLMVVAFFELISLNYIYGIQNLRKDIRMMLGYKPGYWWVFTWLALSPAAIGFIFVFSLFQNVPASYGGYVFPEVFQILGWLMVCSSLIFIPGMMLNQMIRKGLCKLCRNKPNSLAKVCGRSVKSDPEWGPCVKKYWPEDQRYARKLAHSQKVSEFSYPNNAYKAEDSKF